MLIHKWSLYLSISEKGALWRRITRLSHKRLQIHLCVEMQRINGTSFMRQNGIPLPHRQPQVNVMDLCFCIKDVLSVCYAISVVYSCLWCVLNHPLSNELSTSRYNRIIKITQVVAHFRNKEKISFALTEIVLQYYFKSPVVKSTGLTHINRNFSCSYLNINACFDGAIMV